MKRMLPEMKHNIMSVKLYSWPLTFRKVMWQQIWVEVVVLIQTSFRDLWI